MKQHGHQGDVQFYKVDTLPDNIKKVEKQFLAASEQSGSFHALFGNYDLYEAEDSSFVIDVKEECILNHSLEQHLQGVSFNNAIEIPKKDHRHSVIEPGIYRVGIQQVFNPLAGVRQEAKD